LLSSARLSAFSSLQLAITRGLSERPPNVVD